MSFQPRFEADYVEKRSRLTTFFRLILIFPHYIVLALWAIAAVVVVFIAWFALVFTGRWPQGMYDFVAGFLRYATAVEGYYALLTDKYPPFSSDTSGYPVRLLVPAPKTQYSRAKVFFRIVLMIPVAIIWYAMRIVWSVGAILAWITIVIIGRQPRGLQDMIVLGFSYQQRASTYALLLTEDWPSFENPPAPLGPGPLPTSSLPPSSSGPPAAPEAPAGVTPGVEPPSSGGFAPPVPQRQDDEPPGPDSPPT